MGDFRNKMTFLYVKIFGTFLQGWKRNCLSGNMWALCIVTMIVVCLNLLQLSPHDLLANGRAL